MTKAWKPPYPHHPAVNWSVMRPLKKGRRLYRMMVEITCPWCKQKRFDDASQVRYRVSSGSFTGYCYKDRLIKKQRADRLPRPHHPQVDWDNVEVVKIGKQRLTRVRVTCPSCHAVRYSHPGQVARSVRNNTFSGKCYRCSRFYKKREWTTLAPGRKIDPGKGYVRLSLSAVPESDRDLFRAMSRGTFVFEHRFVMAKALGRPLRPNELVDHMDGDKLNNDPANLRLYIRGKNMPGETTGYGTYYNEWQTALAEIARLTKLLPG